MAEIQFVPVELWDRTSTDLSTSRTGLGRNGQRPRHLSRHFFSDHNCCAMCVWTQIWCRQINALKNGYRALSVSAEMATFQLSTGNWSCCCGCLLSQFQVPRGHPGTLNDELGLALMPSLFAPGVFQFVCSRSGAIQPVI